MKVNLGGKRLGSGDGMTQNLHGYATSWHNLSHAWRSPMCVGTLVPFLVQPLTENGSEMKININDLIRTHPTIGPVFGSYKLQADVFKCPLRLYHRQLHNNKKNVGLNMESVLHPIVHVHPNNPDRTLGNLNQQQINSGSLWAYLGVRGLGTVIAAAPEFVAEELALGHLMYWDIVANYYANLQQESVAYLGTPPTDNLLAVIDSATQGGRNISLEALFTDNTPSNGSTTAVRLLPGIDTVIRGAGLSKTNVVLNVVGGEQTISDLLEAGMIVIELSGNRRTMVISANQIINMLSSSTVPAIRVVPSTGMSANGAEIMVKTCPVANIDTMRENILGAPLNAAFQIYREENQAAGTNLAPYNENFIQHTMPDGSGVKLGAWWPLNGLALKTYQSDRFNNWLNTEWLDGDNGVNEITKITAAVLASDGLSMDVLNLQQKMYMLLNRVAIMDGSYRAWQEAVFAHGAPVDNEIPKYCGGMSAEIVFNEVVSTADSSQLGDSPLGTLGGRGTVENKRGGVISIYADEPSWVMGIISITPRIDYSQGNKWFTRIRNMNQWHKPGLDGIGFQPLITSELAAWSQHPGNFPDITYTSIGKQTAWIEYQTEQNQTYGDFASDNSESYMCLNRIYRPDADGNISNYSTYIDPRDWNKQFAVLDRSATHFWVQLGLGIKVKRISSASQIPNL